MSNAARLNVLPLVTDCEDASGPAARRRVPSTIPKNAADPVAVTEPSENVATTTLRPVVCACGAPMDRLVFVPSL